MDNGAILLHRVFTFPIAPKHIRNARSPRRNPRNTPKRPQNRPPYSQWEQKRTQIKERLNNLPAYVHQAVETINKEEQKMGRPPKLDLEKKVNLFIMVRFLNKSNRMAEQSLHYFQPLFGVDVSCKYIERLYSDPEVKLVLHMSLFYF